MKTLSNILLAVLAFSFVSCQNSTQPSQTTNSFMSAAVPLATSPSAVSAGSVTSSTDSKIVTSARLNGTLYYINVITLGAAAQIWLRKNPYMCSSSDLKVLTITAANASYKVGMSDICKLKGYYDAGKLAAGCGSVLGTGVCIGAGALSLPADPVTAGGASVAVIAVCEATVNYAASKGALDCADGAVGYIANALSAEPGFTVTRVAASLSNAQWTDALDHALDFACRDVQ